MSKRKPGSGHTVDNNHSRLIAELRQVEGVSVFDLSAMGHGCSDIIVGFQKKNWLFEIKRPKRKRSLSPAQRRFRDSWTGQYGVITSMVDALRAMGLPLELAPVETAKQPVSHRSIYPPKVWS